MSVYSTSRRPGAGRDSAAELERNRAEDLRLAQRINVAAAELRTVRSADVPADIDALRRRRAALDSLQSEIDGLYAQRRRLVAERGLLTERRAPRAGAQGWRILAEPA